MVNDNDFGSEKAAMELALLERDLAWDAQSDTRRALNLLSALEFAQKIPEPLFHLGVLDLTKRYLTAVSQAAKADIRYNNAEWAYQQSLLRGHKE